MIDQFCPNPVIAQRLHSGPLSAHIDTLAQLWVAQGYASSTLKYAMRLFAALSTWLQQQPLTATDLDQQRLEEFLQARYQHHRPHRNDRATLRRLLEHLQQSGIIATPSSALEPQALSPVEEAFRGYLVHQRSLAATTVGAYLDTVGRFLQQRFGTQAANYPALCAQDITEFMRHQSRRYSPGQAQTIASALRSFFRFLLQHGMIAIDLTQCVPAPARRRLSTLPKFMPDDEVEQLLESVDQGSAQGRRNYAILLLLARLGLRAGEVANLTLEDLDWEAGELIVPGKGGRRDRLPLLDEIGQALANYLRDGRPACATRKIFVRSKAPWRGFVDGQAVGTIVSRALTRAGLHPARKGAHVLRHSLATRLLRNGASLTEIGELLRHRDLNTTQIYAKVDHQALRALAPPWPGGAA